MKRVRWVILVLILGVFCLGQRGHSSPAQEQGSEYLPYPNSLVVYSGGKVGGMRGLLITNWTFERLQPHLGRAAETSLIIPGMRQLLFNIQYVATAGMTTVYINKHDLNYQVFIADSNPQIGQRYAFRLGKVGRLSTLYFSVRVAGRGEAVTAMGRTFTDTVSYDVSFQSEYQDVRGEGKLYLARGMGPVRADFVANGSRYVIDLVALLDVVAY